MKSSAHIRCHRRRQGTVQAFTLVELLVVLGVMVILLGLLLPALGKVKAVQERIACAAVMRQVGMAVWSYSGDNWEQMPDRHGGGPVVFDTFWMLRNDGDFANLGLLIDRVDDTRSFYCVTQTADRSPSIAHNSSANPWPGKGKSPKGLNSAFPARPVGVPPGKQPAWTTNNYANKVIYSDFIGVDDWPGQGRFKGAIQAPHNGRIYNRLFGDGSVLAAAAQPLNALRPIDKKMPNPHELTAYYELLDVLP